MLKSTLLLFVSVNVSNPAQMAQQVGAELNSGAIDAAFVGIGENGHLVFNDPPADFETEQPYLIVALDEACRRQQVGEGWFSDISQVPRQAVSMSVRQILKAQEIVAVVPDARKARTVKACLEDEITPLVPASILRTHACTTLYLDHASASRLSTRDGAKTWSKSFPGTNGITGLAATSEKDLWIGAGNPAGTTSVVHSQDGGVSWRPSVGFANISRWPWKG